MKKLIKETYKDVNFCLRCGTKLELKFDHEEKPRPKCPNCGWTYYKNPIPASACIILNDQNQIVIVKRKFAPKAGEWALPSGYVEIYQEPDECALEEMLEETNLQGSVKESLGYFSDFSPIYEKVISFGFLMEIQGGKLRAGDDAAEARSVSIDSLPTLAFSSHRHFVKLVRDRLKKDRYHGNK
ncbi:MAG: NUDIX hydrolase [Candidatus Cloacimonadota bacterium]|nr:NUDIX hydrolase [Candidatus Cloacimonadota bacterium]